MSGGVIVLITAAGSAFGAMLKVAQVGDAIKMMFGGNTQGLAILFLAFGIAALLKIAQGSSTAAMIITSGMMPACWLESSCHSIWFTLLQRSERGR